MPEEVEIKFVVADISALEEKLRILGFHVRTPSTHELNTLFDTAKGALRKSGQLLRLRHYGSTWTLTHKDRGRKGIHKTRVETETEVSNGESLRAILLALGYHEAFCYEKFRAEWGDAEGHLLVDQTPIGTLAEIEGPPEWIDSTAERLGIERRQYITNNYVELFREWKERVGSAARNMTFAECGTSSPG